jgi:hypothetical protein
MKKSIQFFAALIIMMSFTLGAWAQQSDNDHVAANAEVVAPVSVTGDGDLSFGMVTPEVTKTINTEGGVIAGTAGTSGTIGAEAAGHFLITKGLNTEVTLAFSLPEHLIFDTDHELDISFADAGSVKLAKLAAASGGEQEDLLFTPATGITTENTGAKAEYFADDAFDVYIGGTVAPIETQVAGVYTANITLTATYN